MHTQRIGIEPRCAAGQIEHAFFHATTDGRRIKQQQIGCITLAYQTAVLQTKNLCGSCRDLMHRIGQTHLAKIARPMPHQMQAKASVIEEGQMRAGVTQGNQTVGVIQ